MSLKKETSKERCILAKRVIDRLLRQSGIISELSVYVSALALASLEIYGRSISTHTLPHTSPCFMYPNSTNYSEASAKLMAAQPSEVVIMLLR